VLRHALAAAAAASKPNVIATGPEFRAAASAWRSTDEKGG
jgi:hypothetical protein